MKRYINTIILIFFVVFVFNSILVGKETKGKGKNIKKASKIVAVVSFIKGKALVKKSGSKKWVPLKVKTKLTKNALIKTFPKTEVRLKLKNKQIVKIKKRGVIKVEKLLTKRKTVKGSLKSVFFKVGNKKQINKFGVTAVGGVRGADVSKKKQKVKSKDVNWEK